MQEDRQFARYYGQVQVTDNDALDVSPSYSPIGKRIVYEGYYEAWADIFTINVGGGMSS
jgi:Tol biopolymer transport system component